MFILHIYIYIYIYIYILFYTKSYDDLCIRDLKYQDISFVERHLATNHITP